MAWTFAVKLIVLARGIISFTLEGGTRKNTRVPEFSAVFRDFPSLWTVAKPSLIVYTLCSSHIMLQFFIFYFLLEYYAAVESRILTNVLHISREHRHAV